MSKKDLIPFTKSEEKFIEKIVEKRHSAEVRFPLIYTLLGTFGFVSTLYGFEKLIDQVDLFVDKPWILLIVGVLTLALTGSIYKKLG